MTVTYCCECPCPGQLEEPYHMPGYLGHIPTYRDRIGGSIGKLSNDAFTDPCTAQAPCPIMDRPVNRCGPPTYCCTVDPVCAPLPCCPPRPKLCNPCFPAPSDWQEGSCMGALSSRGCNKGNEWSSTGCCGGCCDERAPHINRGPYVCPCKPQPDTNVYRCCEAMNSTYFGHVPGFAFHSTGRTTGRASWGTKQYIKNCMLYNTFNQC